MRSHTVEIFNAEYLHFYILAFNITSSGQEYIRIFLCQQRQYLCGLDRIAGGIKICYERGLIGFCGLACYNKLASAGIAGQCRGIQCKVNKGIGSGGTIGGTLYGPVFIDIIGQIITGYFGLIIEIKTAWCAFDADKVLIGIHLADFIQFDTGHILSGPKSSDAKSQYFRIYVEVVAVLIVILGTLYSLER